MQVAAFVRDRRAAEPGARVLFHCKGGRARAATAAVAAMVDDGSTAEAAMRLIKAKRSVGRLPRVATAGFLFFI